MTQIGQAATWGLLLGILTPLLTALVEQPHLGPRIRWVIGWVSSIAVGALAVAAQGVFHIGIGAHHIDWQELVASIGAVIASAEATYRGWVSSGIVPAIERATSPRPADLPTPRPGSG